MSFASSRSADRTLGPVDIALRVAIVGLTLATAYIHSTLGGLLFTLNATGYLVAAVAMVIPLSLAVRFRWVVRLGLIGYAATTIIGWAIQGPYFTTAYIAKAIEVALIVLLAIDFARMDGNPVTVIKSEIAQLSARFGRRSATEFGRTPDLPSYRHRPSSPQRRHDHEAPDPDASASSSWPPSPPPVRPPSAPAAGLGRSGRSRTPPSSSPRATRSPRRRSPSRPTRRSA